MRYPVSSCSASTVCILDSKYDEDGIAGIAYEFDESTLPYGLLNHDVESSETMVTISAASIDKKGKGKHGGGKISIHPGATIKKEKKQKKTQKKQEKNGAKGGLGVANFVVTRAVGSLRRLGIGMSMYDTLEEISLSYDVHIVV